MTDQQIAKKIGKDRSGMFIYLSQLLDTIVLDKNREFVGRVYDVVVRPSEVYPQASLLMIRKGFPDRQYAVIEWANIFEIDDKETWLTIGKDKIIFSQIHNNKEELTLRRDILDQQVVDTFNHKVIRINDIHLLFVDHLLMVAHVDISLRGIIRRLGYEKITDFFVSLVNKNAAYLKKEHLISWKYIQPLSINPASMTIKVNVPQQQFSRIPAADLAEIFQDLDVRQQLSFFKSLDLSTKARIFTHIDFKVQKSLMDDLGNKEIAEVLNHIPSDEATDFLEKLSKDRTVHILGLMETKYSKKLSQLLGYSSDSAGGLMTAEYIAFKKDDTIEAVLQQIKERTFKTEPAQFVYIVDEDHKLVGCTNFRRLILANPRDNVQKAAFPKIYSVRLDSSVKEVAYLMEKYKYYTIPVVDANNVLQGIITVDDILSQVISIAWRRLKRIEVKPS